MHGRERVGDGEHEPEEEGGHREPDGSGPGHQRVGHPPPEVDGDRGQVAGEHQTPQQNRTGQVGPHGGDAEQQRGPQAVVVGHVLQTEVPRDQRMLHGRGGHDGAEQDHPRVRAAGAQKAVAAAADTEDQGDTAGDSGGKSEEDGALADGGVHGVLASGAERRGWQLRLEPVGMGLDVAGRVLDHDLVAGVHVTLPVAFEDDRDTRLEELRGLGGVDHVHDDVVGHDGEHGGAGQLPHVGLDGPLDAELAAAERGPVGDRLVGRLEIDGGVAEPFQQKEDQRAADDERRRHLPAPRAEQGSPPARGRRRRRRGGGQRHVFSRAGRLRASTRPRRSVRHAYSTTITVVAPQPPAT